jgi:SAM-dependent methyltransferase
VSVTDFDDAIAHLPIDPSQYTFIDLGSGKGRALILAFKNGFRRVVGVEFSAELCAVARRNLAATGVNAEVVYQSASDYLFPDEPTVIFLYNPFRPAVLVPVLKRLHPGTWIIYVNPEYASAVDSLNFRLAYRTDDNAICTDGISIWQAR